MRTTDRRPILGAVTRLLLVLGTGLACASSAAEAQFGYGGLGYGGFYFHPREVDYLNQRSLLNAAKAPMGPVNRSVYAGNPNAYTNHLNDEGYSERYNPVSRAPAEYQSSRSYAQAPPAQAPAAPPTAAAPVLPLESFFDKQGKLVWPGEPPSQPDLAAKRKAADLACLAVLNDYNLHNLASVATVTEARNKLVDYGKPALEIIQKDTTPRVADTFHLFLLSLYESLGQAATVPKPPPSPAPAPAAAAAPAPPRP